MPVLITMYFFSQNLYVLIFLYQHLETDLLICIFECGDKIQVIFNIIHTRGPSVIGSFTLHVHMKKRKSLDRKYSVHAARKETNCLGDVPKQNLNINVLIRTFNNIVSQNNKKIKAMNHHYYQFSGHIFNFRVIYQAVYHSGMKFFSLYNELV